MDSIAVSIAVSPCFTKQTGSREKIKLATVLSLSHALFILIGWFFGLYIEKHFQYISPRLAFLILLIIGAKMIYEGLKSDKKIKYFNVGNFFVLMGLGIATSIDALFVAISMALTEFNFILSIVTITLITFILSLISVMFGQIIKTRMRFSVEIFGGIVLIIIGAKILIENLYFDIILSIT